MVFETSYRGNPGEEEKGGGRSDVGGPKADGDDV